MTCQDVHERAAAWADGEAHGAFAAAIASHAAACAACAAVIEEQRVTRALVGRHAEQLRGVAPAGLRAELQQRLGAWAPVIPFPQRQPPVRRQPTRVSRWSVAAALVLAVGGVFAAGGFDGGRLFAAQLALDHFKCLLLDGGRAGVTDEQLESSWQADRGWRITVPPSEPSLGLTLVGLRRCIGGEGQMAHVLYEVDGQRLSLFVVPDSVDAAAADLGIMGVDTKSWHRDGRTYSLVGVAAAASDRVVEFMRSHAR